MLNRLLLIFCLSFIFCSVAYGQEGKFTLVPENGRVPFEATCFDELATAKLMTWREFLEQELSQKYIFENEKMVLQKDLEIQSLQITLDETLVRYKIEIDTRDKELEQLRTVIKKNKKVNMPVVVVVSVLGGVALGFAGAYAIDRAVRQ
tara:strand:+ start:99 stop:545 length:447 start_codon:yes stop_codon:yes gene_type:complete